MANPFVYDEPVSAEALIDRVAELDTLRGRAAEARNSRLEGPRRFGKTSLIRATLAAAELDGAVPIEVNFLGCVTARDVTERIERAYSRQLDGTLRRWFDSLVRTWRPAVSIAPGGVGVQAQPQESAPGLLERLSLPARIHERTGRQCVIAFDEFQEVHRVDPALLGTFRSEIEQHGPAAAYIFSGSHPGLMRTIFSDRRHAFFAQAGPVPLSLLPLDALGEFVDARFRAEGRDLGETLGPLLDATRGHPQRAMLTAYHLYARVARNETATIETWSDALTAARGEARGEISVLWEASGTLERRVLKTVAHPDVRLGSREAEARFGLFRGGAARKTLEALASEGHLIEDASTRTGWRIVDPFLEAWLRDDGESA